LNLAAAASATPRLEWEEDKEEHEEVDAGHKDKEADEAELHLPAQVFLESSVLAGMDANGEDVSFWPMPPSDRPVLLLLCFCVSMCPVMP